MIGCRVRLAYQSLPSWAADRPRPMPLLWIRSTGSSFFLRRFFYTPPSLRPRAGPGAVMLPCFICWSQRCLHRLLVYFTSPLRTNFLFSFLNLKGSIPYSATTFMKTEISDGLYLYLSRFCLSFSSYFLFTLGYLSLFLWVFARYAFYGLRLHSNNKSHLSRTSKTSIVALNIRNNCAMNKEVNRRQHLRRRCHILTNSTKHCSCLTSNSYRHLANFF